MFIYSSKAGLQFLKQTYTKIWQNLKKCNQLFFSALISTNYIPFIKLHALMFLIFPINIEMLKQFEAGRKGYIL